MKKYIVRATADMIVNKFLKYEGKKRIWTYPYEAQHFTEEEIWDVVHELENAFQGRIKYECFDPNTGFVLSKNY